MNALRTVDLVIREPTSQATSNIACALLMDCASGLNDLCDLLILLINGLFELSVQCKRARLALRTAQEYLQISWADKDGLNLHQHGVHCFAALKILGATIPGSGHSKHSKHSKQKAWLKRLTAKPRQKSCNFWRIATTSSIQEKMLQAKVTGMM